MWPLGAILVATKSILTDALMLGRLSIIGVNRPRSRSHVRQTRISPRRLGAPRCRVGAGMVGVRTEDTNGSIFRGGLQVIDPVSLQSLLDTDEADRFEMTESTNKTDKFCEALRCYD